ncbi:MAG: hypothetical protein V3V74_07555 [Nitrosomonadaceae bacterium]
MLNKRFLLACCAIGLFIYCAPMRKPAEDQPVTDSVSISPFPATDAGVFTDGKVISNSVSIMGEKDTENP